MSDNTFWNLDTFWNEEDETFIKCPYCGAEYEPSYEDTWIGDQCVNCYTEETQTFICDDCKHKFTVTPYQQEWRYRTETVDGEMTEEEHENMICEVSKLPNFCPNCGSDNRKRGDAK